jgi:hypothetical protein
VVYLPAEDVFVAVLSNCDCNSPELLTYKLAAIAAGRSYEYKEITISASNLQSYTGVYVNQKGQQRIITESGNKLFSQLGRGPKSQIRPFRNDQFFYDADPMATIEFTRNKSGKIEKLISGQLRGNDTWNKTDKPLPGENGIKISEDILKEYEGVYEVSPHFSFTITKEQDRLFLQAQGQEKFEMFAETSSVFFLKVNDAQLEFVKENGGKITKAILTQGGKEAQAKKIK